MITSRNEEAPNTRCAPGLELMEKAVLSESGSEIRGE